MDEWKEALRCVKGIDSVSLVVALGCFLADTYCGC